ncbi:MAG: NAD(P)/FAD-dependent oxidoreductase, partial [Hyphococcus sp.]
MPFDASLQRRHAGRQRIAVIGTGISGLSAAWLLADAHEVVVYEKDARLGGHTNTVDAELPSGRLPVDTGFIVFNEPSYPNFTAMLAHLGVDTEASCMSFGASIDRGRVEYSGQTLSSVFAKRSNAASPTFWKMLRDIPRFHRDARKALTDGFCEEASLGDFVRERRYGRGFCDHFLKPMAAAIWSTPSVKIFDYPALSFLKFFDNHGLLQVLNLPVWHTVSGGARTYAHKLEERFADNVRLSAGVVAVERAEDAVVVTDETGGVDRFDQVVIAAHGDAAARMLKDADDDEQAILSAFRYQENRAVLHLDPAHMPRRRRAWSSWNYMGEGDSGAVTYWMNRLQNLRCPENVFVTLNPAEPIREELTIAAFDYDHPMFDARSWQA